MKIGILTLPFHTNLGGILQNYALQETLRRMGHDPYTIHLQQSNISLGTKILSITKRFLSKVFYGSDLVVRVFPTRKEKELIFGGIDKFIKSKIQLTKPIEKIENTHKIYMFDAYIVGSD